MWSSSAPHGAVGKLQILWLLRQVPVNPLMIQLCCDQHQLQQQQRDFLGLGSSRGCQLLPNRRAANISAIRTSQKHKLKATDAFWLKSKKNTTGKAARSFEEAQACSYLRRTFFWGSETWNREYGLSQHLFAALLATISVKTYKMPKTSCFETFNLWTVKKSQDAQMGGVPQACRVSSEDCGNNLPFQTTLIWFHSSLM